MLYFLPFAQTIKGTVVFVSLDPAVIIKTSPILNKSVFFISPDPIVLYKISHIDLKSFKESLQ